MRQVGAPAARAGTAATPSSRGTARGRRPARTPRGRRRARPSPSASRPPTCATSPASRTACSVARSRDGLLRQPADRRTGRRPWVRPAVLVAQRIDQASVRTRAQRLLDHVELGLADDQRRRELDDRVAAVVGPAVQAGVEQRLGQEAAQQPLGLVVVEGLLGGLVLDQLDAVEVPGAAYVADDRQVGQLLQRRPERALVGLHVGVDALALEDVEVGQGHGGTTPGGRRRCSRGRSSCDRCGTARTAGRRDHRADGGVAGGHALGAGDDVRHVRRTGSSRTSRRSGRTRRSSRRRRAARRAGRRSRGRAAR